MCAEINNLSKIVSRKEQKGFSIIELVIVLLIVAIVVVFALPQVISSRRLFKFAGVQRQVVTTLRETRQEAMSQRTAVTFRYNDSDKNIVIWGGSFGNLGDSRNRVVEILNDGLQHDDVVYGRPDGVSTAALGDGTNLTNLTSNIVEITFQTDGSVIDSNNNPQNKAIFFYNPQTAGETAFAVSVLGAGGRTKLWRYNQNANIYVE